MLIKNSNALTILQKQTVLLLLTVPFPKRKPFSLRMEAAVLPYHPQLSLIIVSSKTNSTRATVPLLSHPYLDLIVCKSLENER